METKDNEVRSVRHSPKFDTDSINRAVERASKDDTFIEKAINLIKDLSFPAFKRDIIDHAKRRSSSSSSSANPEIIALFESLNGYIQYKDMYHLRKALEENNSEKKKTNQITQPAREQPTEPSRSAGVEHDTNKGVSAVRREERRDYTQVSPSAMSNFICNKCGKQFQNQNDLIQHQRFEGSENANKNSKT
jgi:hypothetical protein